MKRAARRTAKARRPEVAASLAKVIPFYRKPKYLSLAHLREVVNHAGVLVAVTEAVFSPGLVRRARAAVDAGWEVLEEHRLVVSRNHPRLECTSARIAVLGWIENSRLAAELATVDAKLRQFEAAVSPVPAREGQVINLDAARARKRACGHRVLKKNLPGEVH